MFQRGRYWGRYWGGVFKSVERNLLTLLKDQEAK